MPAPQGGSRNARGGGDLPFVPRRDQGQGARASKSARSTSSPSPFNVTRWSRASTRTSPCSGCGGSSRRRNAELARELGVAQELLTDARRRVEGPLLGDSPAIRALRESIARYAADADVLLLTGPQGGGHEAAARAIHHASPRSRQAFIHVNCAMLPSGTGSRHSQPAGRRRERRRPALGSRLSLLELATQARLYLEEIQRLPGDLQGRLADVLERREASRERGEPAVPDVRVIAYSSAPLADRERISSEAAGAARTQTAASAVARGAPRRRPETSPSSSSASTPGGLAPSSRRSPSNR